MKYSVLIVVLMLIPFVACEKRSDGRKDRMPQKADTMSKPREKIVATRPEDQVHIAFTEFFGGMIRMVAKSPDKNMASGAGKNRSVYLIRTEKAFRDHISRVPRNLISKGPSGPNTDPVLKNPIVDFSKEMLFVVEYDYMWRKPKVLFIKLKGDKLQVYVNFEEAPHQQHAFGVASYVAVSIPLSDHKPELMPSSEMMGGG